MNVERTLVQMTHGLAATRRSAEAERSHRETTYLHGTHRCPGKTRRRSGGGSVETCGKNRKPGHASIVI
jgi:hypothetical protein